MACSSYKSSDNNIEIKKLTQNKICGCLPSVQVVIEYSFF